MNRAAMTRMLGVLLGLLTVTAAAPGMSSGSAAEWLCEGKVITTSCNVVSENLEAFVLEDMGVPMAVECLPEAVTTTGTVGPGVADETRTMAINGFVCPPAAKAENLEGEKVSNACIETVSMSGVHLPWRTEGISESGGVEKWDLVATGIGQPGFLMECKTLLGTVDDVCTTKEAATALLYELKNLAAEGTEPALVTGFFLKNPLESKQALKCSVGGEEDGLMIGEWLLAALNFAGALVSLEFDTP